MAVPRSKLFLCLLLSGCTYADARIEVDTLNNLSSCIKIERESIVFEQGVPFLNIRYTKNKHLSECGCKSALMSYSSSLKFDDYETVVLSGKFVFSDNNDLLLPISTSTKVIGSNNVYVTLSCAAPD